MGTDSLAASAAISVSAFMAEIGKAATRFPVRVILDVGSRDALVAICLKEYFPEATVYAFECFPPCIEMCKKNIGNRPDVILVDKAISDVCGPIDFYGTEIDDNVGASSLYVVNPAFSLGRYRQDKMTVEATTLEQWAAEIDIDAIDILWLDLQGAELKVLKGLGDLIGTVKVVYTEVGYKEMYLGQPLFPELDQFLTMHRFRLLTTFNYSEWFGDALYVGEEL